MKQKFDVVILADDTAFKARLAPTPTGTARLRLIADRLPFDVFDALLSSVFAGNALASSILLRYEVVDAESATA